MNNDIKYQLYNELENGLISRSIVQSYDNRLDGYISNIIPIKTFTTFESTIGVDKLREFLNAGIIPPPPGPPDDVLEKVVLLLDKLSERDRVIKEMLSKDWSKKLPESINKDINILEYFKNNFDSFVTETKIDRDKAQELYLTFLRQSNEDFLFVLVSEQFKFRNILDEYKEVPTWENVIDSLSDCVTLRDYNSLRIDLEIIYRNQLLNIDYDKRLDQKETESELELKLIKFIDVFSEDKGFTLLQILGLYFKD